MVIERQKRAEEGGKREKKDRYTCVFDVKTIFIELFILSFHRNSRVQKEVLTLFVRLFQLISKEKHAHTSLNIAEITRRQLFGNVNQVISLIS